MALYFSLKPFFLRKVFFLLINKKSQLSQRIDTKHIQEDSIVIERYQVEISNRSEVLEHEGTGGVWKVFKENSLIAATSVA